MADLGSPDPVAAEVRAEIAQLMASYCHGIDHHDWNLVRRCFTDDAELFYGQYDGDPAGFVEYAAEGLGCMIRHTHQLGQTYIECLGEALRTETYATCFHRYEVEAGREDLIVGARYIDDLVRGQAGSWRIIRRIMAYDWTRVDPVAKELEDPTVIRGSAQPTDPWYKAGGGYTAADLTKNRTSL